METLCPAQSPLSHTFLTIHINQNAPVYTYIFLFITLYKRKVNRSYIKINQKYTKSSFSKSSHNNTCITIPPQLAYINLNSTIHYNIFTTNNAIFLSTIYTLNTHIFLIINKAYIIKHRQITIVTWELLYVSIVLTSTYQKAFNSLLSKAPPIE